MRTNQNLIRSTLCDNPALQKLVTLYPVGLGAAPTTCYIFSGDINLGAQRRRGEGGGGVVVGPGELSAIAWLMLKNDLGGATETFVEGDWVTECNTEGPGI